MSDGQPIETVPIRGFEFFEPVSLGPESRIRRRRRPAADIGRVFGGKPVAVLGALPGGIGTVLSQNAWLPVLRTLETMPRYGGRLIVSCAGSVFDGGGWLASDTTKEQLRQFIEGFVAFVLRVLGLER
ncbi:MAG: hypothetical protein WA624_16310 [Methylocella sp.]